MQSGVPSHCTVATLAPVTPNGLCASWRARGGRGRAGEGTGPSGEGGGGCHSAWINLCPPPAPGEAAARSPLPSLSKHLLTPPLSAIDCRLVDTTGSCKFITPTAGNQTQHRVLGWRGGVHPQLRTNPQTPGEIGVPPHDYGAPGAAFSPPAPPYGAEHPTQLLAAWWPPHGPPPSPNKSLAMLC